ncbi:hypothetical protein FDECE_15680 [Fusarium decemcellulare]|nr:hypothetical protein FDECE_15680 [Fusarium decemcellulare]
MSTSQPTIYVAPVFAAKSTPQHSVHHINVVEDGEVAKRQNQQREGVKVRTNEFSAELVAPDADESDNESDHEGNDGEEGEGEEDQEDHEAENIEKEIDALLRTGKGDTATTDVDEANGKRKADEAMMATTMPQRNRRRLIRLGPCGYPSLVFT